MIVYKCKALDWMVLKSLSSPKFLSVVTEVVYHSLEPIKLPYMQRGGMQY